MNSLIECIEIIINKLYPEKEDRLNTFFSKEELQIDLLFYKEESLDKTQIMFLKGNYTFKSSTNDILFVDDLLTDDNIKNIIDYILKSHTIISNFIVLNNSFMLEFSMNSTDTNKKGISCKKILIKFDFSKYPNYNKIMGNYLRTILKNYYKELSNTKKMKDEYEKYINKLKKDFINNLSNEELIDFILRIPKEELIKLIFSLDNDVFMTLYNENNKLKLSKNNC